MMKISYSFFVLGVLTGVMGSNVVFAQADNVKVCPGQGYLVADDWDGDGFLDVVDGIVDAGDSTVNELDLCIFDFDANNDDNDGDLIGDVCDNCPLKYNEQQEDADADGTGDACDDDIDGDLVLNVRGIVVSSALDTDSGTHGTDNGIDTTSVTSVDTNTDTTVVDMTDSEAMSADTGTEVSTASEGSLISRDNCPLAYNPNQSDIDGDGLGDACDNDLDGDGVSNEVDFCPFDRTVHTLVDVLRYDSADCLGDSDGDGVLDYHVDKETGLISKLDNCQFHKNGLPEGADSRGMDDDDSQEDMSRDVSQKDMDGDGEGDACDPDMDGDGVIDTQDNCIYDTMVEAISAFNKEQDMLLVEERSPLVHYSGWTDEDWLRYLANPAQVDEDKDRIGDTCDLDFHIPTEKGYAFDNCYVVLDDTDNCLRVTDPALQVYSPAVIASKTSDDPIRLRIFANRPNVKLGYTWSRVGGDPDGIEIENSKGIVTCSSGYEYHYDIANIDLSAVYETKLSGSYLLELKVSQLNPDGTVMVGPANSAATYVVINSSGTDDYIADSCGCAAVGSRVSRSWIGVLLLLLVGIVLRRRFI